MAGSNCETLSRRKRSVFQHRQTTTSICQACQPPSAPAYQREMTKQKTRSWCSFGASYWSNFRAATFPRVSGWAHSDSSEFEPIAKLASHIRSFGICIYVVRLQRGLMIRSAKVDLCLIMLTLAESSSIFSRIYSIKTPTALKNGIWIFTDVVLHTPPTEQEALWH